LKKPFQLPISQMLGLLAARINFWLEPVPLPWREKVHQQEACSLAALPALLTCLLWQSQN